MPLAFAGLLAIWYRRERPVPDPRENGSGRRMKLVLIRDNGRRGEIIQVNKIVKSDAVVNRVYFTFIACVFRA